MLLHKMEILKVHAKIEKDKIESPHERKFLLIANFLASNNGQIMKTCPNLIEHSYFLN